MAVLSVVPLPGLEQLVEGEVLEARDREPRVVEQRHDLVEQPVRGGAPREQGAQALLLA
jgi:hypothetical protein